MQPEIQANQNVAELLTRFPQVIPLFLERRMGCIGCSMSRFEDLADVSAIYGLDLNHFLRDINRAIQPRS